MFIREPAGGEGESGVLEEMGAGQEVEKEKGRRGGGGAGGKGVFICCVP